MAVLKPDWESDGVQLYCGDCRDVMPQLPAGSVDAVVTDPPYGISHPCDYRTRGRGGRDYPDIVGDDTRWDPAPVLAIGVPTVLWGANYFADKLPPSGGWLVWDKDRPERLAQATCELAWTNCVKGVRRFRHLWNGYHRASERLEYYHATQKPVALFEWLLALPWIVDRRRVLDPYMGAGPTGVACVRTARRFVGIEIERKYFDIARQRIKAAQKGLTFGDVQNNQAPLFHPVGTNSYAGIGGSV